MIPRIDENIEIKIPCDITTECEAYIQDTNRVHFISYTLDEEKRTQRDLQIKQKRERIEVLMKYFKSGSLYLGSGLMLLFLYKVYLELSMTGSI